MPEKSIGERLETLKGIARQKWLRKWQNWLLELTPPEIDPAELWGSPLKSLEDVERVLEEHCSDLTNGECYNQLARTVRRVAVTRFDYDPDVIEKYTRDAELLHKANELLEDTGYGVFRPERAEELLDAYKRRSLGDIISVLMAMLAYDYGLSGEDFRKGLDTTRDRFERLLPFPGRKYVPAIVSRNVKQTGAHYMCIMRKLAEKDVDMKTEKAETFRQAGVECVREGKLSPTIKYFFRLTLRGGPRGGR